MDLVEAKVKTEKWMYFFGLLDKGWTFELEDTGSKCINGRCYYDRKVIALNTTKLGAAKTFDDVLSTVFHEITHALVGYRANKNGHDIVFQRRLEQVIKAAYGL